MMPGYPDRALVTGSGTVTGSVALNCQNFAGTTNIPCEFRGSKYSFPVGVQVFASNAAAITGGLTAGDLYVTSTGQLMKVY
jgi:hypothetical protein